MLFVHCILCISCICFVFVSYALTLSYEWPEFYVNKDMFCSVNKDFCHLLITQNLCVMDHVYALFLYLMLLRYL